MEKKNNSGILVGIIIGLIIASVAVACLLSTGTMTFKQASTDNQTNSGVEKEIKTKTVSDVVGEYTSETINIEYDDPNFTTASVTLTLYNNGIFTYTFRHLIPQGMLGNYTIEGDKVTLTAWFSTGSSPDLNIISGTKTLKITEEGKILDDNMNFNAPLYGNIKSVTLTKTDKEITSFDPSERMVVACLEPVDGKCGQPAGTLPF